MYWSVYDTLLVACGVVCLALAFVPVPRGRAVVSTAAIIFGAGLLLWGVFAGFQQRMTYPLIAFLVPLLVGAAVGAIMLFGKKSDAGAAVLAPLPANTGGLSQPSPAWEQVSSVGHVPPTGTGWQAVDDDRSHMPATSNTDMTEVLGDLAVPAESGHTAEQAADPSTDADTLHRIALDAPELWSDLLRNPSLYDELRAWIIEQRGERAR